MRVLIPDVQFDGEPTVEIEAFEGRATFDVHHARSAADIPDEVLRACDAILLWHIVDIDEAMVAKLDTCKIITRLGIGYDRIDTEACGARGIRVSNVPSYDMTDVVNSTIAMVLTLQRGLLSYHEALKADIRGNWAWEGPPTLRRVRGQNFGIVGCGRIGTAVAVRARALGMSVGYFDPYLPTGHEMSLDFKRFGSLEELLAWSDVLSLHTPLNAETTNMINRSVVDAMKDDTILCNCARGGLIDLDALEHGIRTGKIGGAALDAFTLEPPAPHPLLDAWARDEDWVKGRLCITPHSSFYSRTTLNEIRRDAARTAFDYLAHGTWRNAVNAAALKE
jgi:phosphoglycerate dehydrogenase-like enzyme